MRLLLLTILLVIEIEIQVDHVVICVQINHPPIARYAWLTRVLTVRGVFCECSFWIQMSLHSLLQLGGWKLILLKHLLDQHEVLDVLSVHWLHIFDQLLLLLLVLLELVSLNGEQLLVLLECFVLSQNLISWCLDNHLVLIYLPLQLILINERNACLFYCIISALKIFLIELANILRNLELVVERFRYHILASKIQSVWSFEGGFDDSLGLILRFTSSITFIQGSIAIKILAWDGGCNLRLHNDFESTDPHFSVLSSFWCQNQWPACKLYFKRERINFITAEINIPAIVWKIFLYFNHIIKGILCRRFLILS